MSEETKMTDEQRLTAMQALEQRTAADEACYRLLVEASNMQILQLVEAVPEFAEWTTEVQTALKTREAAVAQFTRAMQSAVQEA